MFIRVKLWVKTVLINVFNRPLRLTLSVIGLIISSFLIAMAVFYLDALYNAKMAECNSIPENCLLICDYPEEYESQLSNIEDDCIAHSEKCKSGLKITIKSKNGTGEVLLYSIVGVPAWEDILSYWYYGIPKIRENRLQSGRFISDRDIEESGKVCVIDQHTSECFFTGGSAIDQFITFNTDVRTVTFQIIGVETNSFATQRDLENSGNEYGNSVSTTIYIPLTTFEELFGDSYFNSVLVYSDEDSENFDENRELYQQYIERNECGVIVDKKSETNNAMLLFQATKDEVLPIIVIIFIFSGLNAMNIILFGIKERIGEIGIRKAFGATKEQIIFQFIMEFLVISLLAAIISVLMATICMILFDNQLQVIFGSPLEFQFKWEILLFPIAVSMAQGILFSFAPGIYASRISVVHALKFE